MDATLLAAARAGDGDAFRTLVDPHLRALHVHCYRMLASFHEAEDAMQDTLVRAWRALDTYEGHAPLLHWLNRIATTTCLRARENRARRPTTVADVSFLQPYPDALLDQLGDADPAGAAERRETVALAFVAALQALPPTQRAALILRDVLGWRSAEVADLLQTSVPAVNSALQRARTTMVRSDQVGTKRPLEAVERQLLDRFVPAWQRTDIAALADLLVEDVRLRMPPERVEIRGRAAVAEFFATVPAEGRLDQIRLAPLRANGHPALATYLPADKPYGIMVLTMVETGIATITGFPDPRLFDAFG